MIRVILIVVAMLGVICVGVYILLKKSVDEIGKPLNYSEVIRFDPIQQSIYVQARIWGMTGDHELIVICSNPIVSMHEIDPTHCYQFHGREIYYKKIYPDSLEIYSDDSGSENDLIHSFDSIKVKMIRLKNYDEIMDYRNNYRSYGLNRVGALPESKPREG